jgi:MFS family permease
MRHYSQNARWLLWFAPFRALSISAAYLTPFFVLHGMSTAQIFLLQSIFSAAYLLWEIPSGMLADRLGRAASIKISAPIAAIGMFLYGLSGEFWQFVVCELILALANGLISGIDIALLVDSLKADGKEKDFVRLQQRMDGLGFASTAVAVPLALVLVHFFGVASTLLADGLVTGLGAYFVLKLVEAPRSNGGQDKLRRSAWHALRELVRKPTVRWLVALKTTLNTGTYIAFWLSALYYAALGIPVVLFGVTLAIRSLWKAWLSHRFHQEKHVARNTRIYAGTVGAVYLAMATGQLWLVWTVLGHDVVQALGSSPLTKRLNAHIEGDHRATLNSVANLVQRMGYMIAGPLVGLVVDRTNLATGMVLVGVACSALALVATARLRRLNAFQ